MVIFKMILIVWIKASLAYYFIEELGTLFLTMIHLNNFYFQENGAKTKTNGNLQSSNNNM